MTKSPPSEARSAGTEIEGSAQLVPLERPEKTNALILNRVSRWMEGHGDAPYGSAKRLRMYARIVERLCRRAMQRVNEGRYDAFVAMCHVDVTHRFSGDHALGGTRHTRDGLMLWFERLGRIVPDLKLEVLDIWVKGGPWRTTAIIRWTSTGTPLDGGPYENHGVHIVEMRWGKAVSIDANEDSQAVVDLLRRQAACGISEALAPPILT